MSNEQESSDSTATATNVQFALRKIYVKDLSLESPQAPGIFAEQPASPTINLQLNTESRAVQGDLHEVVLILTITASAKDTDTVMYLVEVKQAGLFSLAGFDEKEMDVMVNTMCPNILFPYAREAISNLVERAGFPQLLLVPINFDALYKKHLDHAKAAAVEASSSATH